VNPQVTLRKATSTSDRACADIVDCSTNSSVQQSFVTTIDDFITGKSTWQCIGSFTGKITNPALLSAQGNVTDAETGAFSLTTIAIGATGATITVAASVTIIGTGAATLTATGVANVATVTTVAANLSKELGKFGVKSEQLQQRITDKLKKAGKLESTAVKDMFQAQTDAVSELVPGLSNDKVVDAVIKSDPSVIQKMKSDYAEIERLATKGSRGQRRDAQDILRKGYAKHIAGSGISDGKADEIMKQIRSAFLPPLGYTAFKSRRPGHFRSRPGSGPRYHRLPVNTPMQF